MSVSASSTHYLNISRDGGSTNTGLPPAQAEAITYVGLLCPEWPICHLVLLNVIQLASTCWFSLSRTICRTFVLSGRSALPPTLVRSAKRACVTCWLNVVDEYCWVTLWHAKRLMLNSCMCMLCLCSSLWEAHLEIIFVSAVFIVFVPCGFCLYMFSPENYFGEINLSLPVHSPDGNEKMVQ